MSSQRGFRLNREESRLLGKELQRAHWRKEYDLALRLRTLLIVGEGKSQSEAASLLKVSKRSVERWISRYRGGGLLGLKKGPFPGRSSRLSVEQKQQLSEIIEKGPESCGLDTGVWTAPIIAKVVKKRFEVTYSCSQIRRILHELGFSLQYPRRKLSKADKERQATWLREEFPSIKKSPERAGDPDVSG